MGQRIKITRNDSASTVVYTPFRELMRVVNSTGTYDFTYVYDGNTLVARINPDGSKQYEHSDHLGSTSVLTNQSGSIVESTLYSPFGEELSGGDKEVKGYTGQFDDEATGQMYYGARYYVPRYGIFGQCDTIKPNIYAPQGLNCYSYGFNNPYRYKDDSGNIPIDVIADVGFIAYDIYVLASEGRGESNENLKVLGLDVGGAAIPYATALGTTYRATKTAERAIDAAKVVDKAGDATKTVEKISDTAKIENTAARGTKITEIGMKNLPQEAQNTIKLIEKGGPFPYKQDASIFRNDQLKLPKQQQGYYKEYTIKTQGIKNRGTQRVVVGKKGETYYTKDHYETFKKVNKG